MRRWILIAGRLRFAVSWQLPILKTLACVEAWQTTMPTWHGCCSRTVGSIRHLNSITRRLAFAIPFLATTANPLKRAERAVSEAGIGYAYMEMASHELLSDQRRSKLCQAGESWARKSLPDLEQYRNQLRGDQSNFIQLLKDSVKYCESDR